jgi:hypothetical protein
VRLAIVLTAAAVAAGGADAAAVDAAERRALVWGGELHSGPESLARWLAARGAEYEEWAERHPEAAARLEGREEEPPQRTEPPTEPVVPTPSVQRSWPLPLFPLVMAAALLLVAATPTRGLGRRAPSRWRLVTAAAGAALVVGWLIGALTRVA